MNYFSKNPSKSCGLKGKMKILKSPFQQSVQVHPDDFL